MSLPAWLTLAALCALGAMSPGPSLAVLVHHALRGSRRRGLVCAFAHAAGVGLYALATALGLAAFLARRPDLYRLVAMAGAAYLAWLGARLLLARGAAAPGAEPATSRAGGLAAAARDGFLTALLNPKIALFFLAIFSQFVGARPDAATVVLLTATAAVIDGAWYAAVALGVSGASGPSRWRRTHAAAGYDRVMGTILLTVAGWMLLRSL